MKWVWLLALAGCQAVFRIDHVGIAVDATTAPDIAPAVDGHADAASGPRIVFLSSTHDGNFSGSVGALAGADAFCQLEATSGALPGMYKAWLSTTTTSAASRMTHGGGPFQLTTGVPVATDWAGFAYTSATGAHFEPINVTASGIMITGESCDVWTNTLSDGSTAQANAGSDCSDWTTSSSGVALPIGRSDRMDSEFTASVSCAELSCNAFARIYCVQQ